MDNGCRAKIQVPAFWKNAGTAARDRTGAPARSSRELCQFADVVVHLAHVLDRVFQAHVAVARQKCARGLRQFHTFPRITHNHAKYFLFPSWYRQNNPSKNPPSWILTELYQDICYAPDWNAVILVSTVWRYIFIYRYINIYKIIMLWWMDSFFADGGQARPLPGWKQARKRPSLAVQAAENSIRKRICRRLRRVRVT